MLTTALSPCVPGDGKEYMNVALKGGGLLVTVDMGGDPLEVNLKPDKVRLDDNQWHTIVINRRVKEVSNWHQNTLLQNVMK